MSKQIPKTKIRITPSFKKAFHLMNDTYEHVFITGSAGTGKSTLLSYFQAKTKKRIAIVAPTGVAALNVKGQTIHSFFSFAPSVTPSQVQKVNDEKRAVLTRIDTLVIDEISMVRADLLDCIDVSLRLNRNKPNVPFGGVQLIFIGDLHQLPPVVGKEEEERFKTTYPTPYFFSANVYREIDVQQVTLKKIYRQEKDERFIEMLDHIRTGKITENDIATWENAHDPWFETDGDTAVHLTTTNKMADQRNQMELQKLGGKMHTFKGQADGNFRSSRAPAPEKLDIREGARVMFTNNDAEKRWVNGSMGTVLDIYREPELFNQVVVHVELDDGSEVKVTPHVWESYEYAFNPIEDKVEKEVVGAYRQYPLMLAWAVTIHKSQGKTFNRVLVDMGWGAFAHGQFYVAVSRATSLSGLILLRPFKRTDIITDPRVIAYLEAQQKTSP